MKTKEQIYSDLYNSSMGTGPKIETPQGWGLIKVQGQEPIIHVPNNEVLQRNTENDLEREQTAIWESFKDSGEAQRVHNDVNSTQDPIDLVYSKMPKNVQYDYDSELLHHMENNLPTKELNQRFGFPNQDDISFDPEEDLKGMADIDRKIYEIEKKKFIEELRKSIELNGGR